MSTKVEERARKAVLALQRMQPMLTSFARGLTGAQIRVSVGDRTQTDGKVIYVRPPIALGDDVEHERKLCDRQDDWGVPLCSACVRHDETMSLLYHEISHVAYGSFGDHLELDTLILASNVSDEAKEKMIRRVTYGRERWARLHEFPLPVQMARLNSFLPALFNSVEDVRVDTAMQRARPGTAHMRHVHIERMFAEGMEMPDGSRVKWSDQPLNSQAIAALIGEHLGVSLDGHFHEAAVAFARLPLVTAAMQRVLDSQARLNDSGVATLEVLYYGQQFGLFISDPETDYSDEKEEADEGGAGEDGAGTDSESGAEQSSGASESGDRDDSGGEEASGESGQPSGDDQAADGAELGDSSGDEPAGDDGEETEADGGAGDRDSGDSGGGSSESSEEDGGDEATAESGEEGGDGVDEPGRDESKGSGGDHSEPAADGDAGLGEPEPSDDGTGEGDGPGGSDTAPFVGESGGGGPADHDDEASVEPESGASLEEELERIFEGIDEAELGTSREAKDNLKVLLGHDSDMLQEEEATHQEAAEINAAILVATHFDTKSVTLESVQITNGANRPSSNGGRVSLRQIDEKILGPSLLHARRAFADNLNADVSRHRKSGRVDARTLGKRAWGDDDRLFKKKSMPGKKDWAVLIGIDISGSTRRTGVLEMTIMSAYAQAELCHRLGLKFAIYAHTGSYTALQIYRIKDFSDPWTDDKVRELSRLQSSQANLDGHTLEFYRKRLDEVQATNKVLMYYSDGAMPAENFEEELSILLREIKVCERKGYILMGVGIASEDPKQYGMDTVRVDSPTDIPNVVKHLGKRIATAI